MCFKDRRFAVPLCFVLFLAAGYFFFGTSRDVADSLERTAFLGTWTDEKGPPGNYTRFYQVARSIPGSLPGEALDGHAVFHDQRGPGDVKAIWNYESWKPLRLNVLFPNQATVTPVKILDHDHMLIRIIDSTKVEIWTNADVFEGPDVIRLTRVAEAP